MTRLEMKTLADSALVSQLDSKANAIAITNLTNQIIISIKEAATKGQYSLDATSLVVDTLNPIKIIDQSSVIDKSTITQILTLIKAKLEELNFTVVLTSANEINISWD